MTTVQREFFEGLYGESLNSEIAFSEGFGLDYNMFCAEQAIIICETLRTEDAIINFNGVDWNEQVKMVTGLSHDHSGNTFEMSCRLAIKYLRIFKSIKRNDNYNKKR
jgi:hypothetical protein